MNYILSATRNYNGIFQSANVKMRGARGQVLPTLRTWAQVLTQFDFTSANFPDYTGETIAGSNYKSMNYSTMKSDVNWAISEHTVLGDVTVVVRWKEDRAVNVEFPRNTIIKVYDTTIDTVKADIMQQFYYTVGKSYDDNKLCIVSMNISLKLV